MIDRKTIETMLAEMKENKRKHMEVVSAAKQQASQSRASANACDGAIETCGRILKQMTETAE